MTDLVVSGLVKRRAALAGELEASQAKVRQLHADIAAVDAVIRQYDPAYPVDAIATKRPRPDAGTTEDMGRTVLDVLRRAGGPLTLPAVADRGAARPRRGERGGAGRRGGQCGPGAAAPARQGRGAEPSEGRKVGPVDVGGRGAAGAPTRNGMVNAKRVYSVFMQNFRGHS